MSLATKERFKRETDMLIPPAQPSNPSINDVPSAALGITARKGSNSGLAVGWAMYEPDGAPKPRPVIWWRLADGAAEVANPDWLLISHRDGAAYVATPSSEIYGRVSDANGANPRAWRWKNSANYDHPFDDKAFTYGYTSNWTLEEIRDATPAGALLGNVKKGGLPRAFLIVRQPPGN